MSNDQVISGRRLFGNVQTQIFGRCHKNRGIKLLKIDIGANLAILSKIKLDKCAKPCYAMHEPKEGVD